MERPKGNSVLRVADLPTHGPTPFDLRPERADLAAMAEVLGLSELKKARLSGEIRPLGKSDWALDAVIGATVVQPCVVTLEPVQTRIDQPLSRQYIADPVYPTEASETEMPEDDTLEPLGETIDLGALLLEALALAVPDYPRADQAELGPANFTEPGKTPLSDEALKPFAGLAALRGALEGENPDDDAD